MTVKDLESLSLDPSAGDGYISTFKQALSDPEVGPLPLLGFLERRVDGFLPDARRICAAGADMSAEDRDLLTLYGKVVASMLLVQKQTGSYSDMKEKLLLLLEFCSAAVRTGYPFLETALDVLNYRIKDLGLSWSIIRDSTSLDVLSFRMMPAIRFDRTVSEPFQYVGRGKVTCTDGILRVFSAEVGESGAVAFSLDGRVEVVTRNSRDEKLKASGQNDAEALAEFAGKFLTAQDAFYRPKPTRKIYNDGDSVDIRITGYGKCNKGRACESLDAENPIRGELLDEELTKGLYTRDIYPYLLGGDCIEGAVVRKGDDVLFSIRDAFVQFSSIRADLDRKRGTLLEARVVRVFNDIERAALLTSNGYGATCMFSEFPGIKEGDRIVGSILSLKESAYGTFINFVKAGDRIGEISRFGEDDDLLGTFITTEERLSGKNLPAENPEEAMHCTRELVSVASILESRSGNMESTVRYRHLLAGTFLYKVLDNGAAIGALIPKTYYLQQCISFAQGYAIQDNHPVSIAPIAEQVIRMLSLWDRPAADVISSGIAPGEDTLPGKLAMLILGLRASSQFGDEIQAQGSTVRKRACELLGVADAYRPDGSSRTGKYGRIETQEVEFKSSYVFRNDGKGADLDRQGRGQVFEAVCGFLNADGGTLYLGVRDDGEPIVTKESGLQGDIDWLRANYQTVRALRTRQLGHPVNKVETVDGFVQFLNCEKELYFKESLLGNILIEATEDADAIRIVVKPSEYEIAYLYHDKEHMDGKAFVRDGGRTVEMSRIQKEKRLMSLKKLGKEVEFVVIIQEAIDRQRKLVFKDYYSGNSGEVKDRHVVPLYLFYNDENVYCYDLDAKGYKQFRLHRITSVVYDADEKAYPLPQEKQKGVDVFRWLEAERKYHVRMSMAIAAKNYFVEEYSMAAKLPEEQFHVDPDDGNRWILDTWVNGVGAVRRFYLGLADRIEILPTEDSDAILADIGEFVRKNILAEE